MKHLKLLLILLLTIIIPISSTACSNKNEPAETKDFVGVAFYQKIDGNLNWTKFSKKPNAINNIISTQNDKIIFDEDPELLFYVYSQNKITESSTDSNFISNTTKDLVTISNNSILFRLERIIENTEILIYYVYKLKDNTYYLEYKETKLNIINPTESFDFIITHPLFNKIILTLETNLKIKDEY